MVWYAFSYRHHKVLAMSIFISGDLWWRASLTRHLSKECPPPSNSLERSSLRVQDPKAYSTVPRNWGRGSYEFRVTTPSTTGYSVAYRLPRVHSPGLLPHFCTIVQIPARVGSTVCTEYPVTAQALNVAGDQQHLTMACKCTRDWYGNGSKGRGLILHPCPMLLVQVVQNSQY